MDESQMLTNKREMFHIEIRRKKLEAIFNSKRPLHLPDEEITQAYKNEIQEINYHQPLLNSLIRVNQQTQKPILEMTQNNLAIQLVMFLRIEGLQDWETLKEILKYLVTFSSLPDEYLQPYLIQHNLLPLLADYIVQIVNETEKHKLPIKGNDVQMPLEMGCSYADKLSFTFIKISQILINCFSDSLRCRGELLKMPFFVLKVISIFKSKMDNAVIVQHLRFIATLLNGLYKQDDHSLKHAMKFIYPICQALQTPNFDKLQEILTILMQLNRVGMKLGYINQIFKANGAISLVNLLQNPKNTQEIDVLLLKNLAEICYHSSTHSEILFHNGLLQQLPSKLIKENKNIQIFSLWIIEYAADSEKCKEQIYQNSIVMELVAQKLVDFDESIRIQASNLVCSLLDRADSYQIIRLCNLNMLEYLINNLNHDNECLYSQILTALAHVLNQETWDVSKKFLTQNQRCKLKQILQSNINLDNLFQIEASIMSLL